MASDDRGHALHSHLTEDAEHVDFVPLLDAVSVALVLHHDDGTIAVATRGAADLFGVEPAELEGRSFGADGPQFEGADGSILGAETLPCLAALRSRETRSAVVLTRDTDGREHWLSIESKPLGELSGGHYALATTLVDVTAQRERERRLSHDDVTGLGNRVLAREHLRRALARADRRRAAVATIFVDLDDFKRVNDTFGHAAGDRLLRTFARRLRGLLRATDFVGRMGGDEFLVVAGDFEQDSESGVTAAELATSVARSITTRILDALAAPLSDGTRSHDLAASMGVAIYPDHGDTIDDLLSNADSAMYAAKKAGRGCVRFYVPGVPEQPGHGRDG